MDTVQVPAPPPRIQLLLMCLGEQHKMVLGLASPTYVEDPEEAPESWLLASASPGPASVASCGVKQ